jgi:hypothetical protein
MKKLMGATSLREITISRHRPARRRRSPTRYAVLLPNAPPDLSPGQDDDFSSAPAEEIDDIRTAAMGTMTTLLAGIAGVSLIVGGSAS